MIWILVVYLLLINIVGFICMGVDKSRSVTGAWRIPEKAFFLLSAIGGSLGCLIGMYLFRHKTKHWNFVVFIPMILVIQVILALILVILI